MSRRQNRPELDGEYLDEQEQKDLISTLLDTDQGLNNFYLKLISTIGFIFGFLKMLVAVLPFNILPFENEAHLVMGKYFSGFIIFWLEWMSASAFIAGAIAMFPGLVKGFIRRWIMLVCSGFTFIGSFLLYIATGSLFTSLWTLGVNSVFLMGCFYVSKLTNNTNTDIQNLSKYMYSHKKV
ncbi:hypothetical protein DFA_10758 [Cavenderia fasciculata]|uniref:Transmembrane protein n=1 Tax=Cavenderia fasciculata TaxID=261658 RepID=F4QBB3_CACFS|nr:uncharacterized protein DFA_10758 [Cavenderia fasciculata]EGG14885.1 hypothetical protein DFA_10758 [Cavenderia fasciculata]|eukprot:XP_004351401.1 hypothetical protein DFA_10758 [Cavenderia fasciculata]